MSTQLLVDYKRENQSIPRTIFPLHPHPCFLLSMQTLSISYHIYQRLFCLCQRFANPDKFARFSNDALYISPSAEMQKIAEKKKKNKFCPKESQKSWPESIQREFFLSLMIFVWLSFSPLVSIGWTKKVSFGIFRIIKTTQNKNFSAKDIIVNVLSLRKF